MSELDGLFDKANQLSGEELASFLDGLTEEQRAAVQERLLATLDYDTGQLPETIVPEGGFEPAAIAEPGERVEYFGEYELLDEIARGGMGVVYKARQVKLNRVVALKMILSGQLAGDEEVKRFNIEAEAAANLDHPGIVPIYEIGEHNGQHYFSMGFVEGESLQDKLRDGPLKPRESAELCVKIAEAVAYAHKQGVIHRDLKPANVLLNQNGEPRITDFGLAKKVEGDSNLTRTGAVMGTPSFMSPEQATGCIDRVGPASDVYSLGAILYATLTSRPPFQASHPLDTLKQVVETEPISIRKLNPSVPEDIETICLQCLEKRIDNRYRNVNGLVDDLGRFLRKEPIVARKSGFTRRSINWIRQRPGILVGVVSFVIFVLVTTAYGLWVETQRLRWTAAHPGVDLEYRDSSLSTLFIAWPFFVIGRLWVRDKLNRNAGSFRAAVPWIWNNAAFGVIWVILSLVFACQLVEILVWKRSFGSGWLVPIAFLLQYAGFEQLRFAHHYYELFTFGDDRVPDLSLIETSEIERHIFAGERSAARRIVERTTGAEQRWSGYAIEKLEAELRLEHPGRFRSKKVYRFALKCIFFSVVVVTLATFAYLAWLRS